MNRVQNAIDSIRRRIDSLNGVGLNGQSIADLESRQALSFGEYVAYQNAQASAFAAGKLTFDEAQIIYAALGPSYQGEGWSKGVDLATKIVVTKIIGELIGV